MTKECRSSGQTAGLRCMSVLSPAREEGREVAWMEGMMEETSEWATDFVRHVSEVERELNAEQAMAEEDSGEQVNVDID